MQNKNLTVGLFVIAGLLLFGLGMFLIGDRRQAFGQHVEFYSEFINLSGLANGSKVRVGGMDAGQVLAIGVPDSPASRFRVKWRIDSKLRGLVRGDSVVTIDTEGVVGGTYLAVRPGSVNARRADDRSTIPSKEPAELSELLARGTGLLSDAQTTLKAVGGKLGNALDNVSLTVSNVNEIAVGLKQGRGPAGMLLRDDALAKQLRQTVTNTGSHVEQVVADLKAGRGTAGMLLRDDALSNQVRSAVADLGNASRQVNGLVSDLSGRQLPQKADRIINSLGETTQQVSQVISDVTKPDRQGMTAGANIRDALTNANVASLNLTEGTEALKHNFLLRGFFRSRGYYNLDRISPEKYRQDRVFTNPANRRSWLAASNLFQDGPNGQEELTTGGKALLDGTLTEYGDTIIESPIVVEGYCGGRPADQVWRSRARAILVRQYLLSRFQLDSANIGMVSLKTNPPNGSGQVAWDGVCVVVLRGKKGK